MDNSRDLVDSSATAESRHSDTLDLVNGSKAVSYGFTAGTTWIFSTYQEGTT